MKNYKKKEWYTFLIVATIICLILGVIFMCTRVISGGLKKQLEINLKEISDQNALAIHNQIHMHHLLLESLSYELQHFEGNMADNVTYLAGFVNEYGLKRLGYCAPDGMTYTTDGVTVDLSFRDFFQRGMKGMYTITGVLADALSESHGRVTIMSAPMYDNDGNIDGVFGLIYDSDKFNDALQVDCFGGRGSSCAINENGEIMVAMGSDSFQLSHNFFTDILGLDSRNDNGPTDSLMEYIASGTEGGGSIYINGENYYHCTPLSLMEEQITWYVLTIVPAAYLDTRLTPIKIVLYIMNGIVISLILAGVFTFVMLSRKQRRLVHNLAYVDSLTGGANLASFANKLIKKRTAGNYLVSMDVTNFNNINIAAGKQVGDALIKQIWSILEKAIHDNEEAARVREDHFALFMCAPDNDALVERLAKISHSIHEYAMDTYNVPGIHACFGIYRMDSDDSPEDAYSKARMAREIAKLSMNRRYVFFREIDHDQIIQDQKLEERFDSALNNHEFELWYQPKYETTNKTLAGSEALIRWRDADGSMISPGRFIPLFERNGSIARLDEYVFREACMQQKKWLAAGYNARPVSVNLSRASLYYSGIVEKYRQILDEYDLDPRYIQIEVTESAIAGKDNIIQLLEGFRNMGIQILMDDFGTGYSSLATLNMRCFDTIKLDKSLIDYIGDENGETLLYYVIRMGHQLGMDITAEGVENSNQLEYLRRQHCDNIQGFFFARPMPAAEYEKLLADNE